MWAQQSMMSYPAPHYSHPHYAERGLEAMEKKIKALEDAAAAKEAQEVATAAKRAEQELDKAQKKIELWDLY